MDRYTTARQGMVKQVRVREYDDEAKYLQVEIKSPTDLPLAAWQSASTDKKHVDEIDIAVPLDAQIRVGDLVAIEIDIRSPWVEEQRFRGALEVGEPDVLEVMVEDGMIEEANDDS